MFEFGEDHRFALGAGAQIAAAIGYSGYKALTGGSKRQNLEDGVYTTDPARVKRHKRLRERITAKKKSDLSKVFESKEDYAMELDKSGKSARKPSFSKDVSETKMAKYNKKRSRSNGKRSKRASRSARKRANALLNRRIARIARAPDTPYLKERTINSVQYTSAANECAYFTWTLNKQDTINSILNDAFKTWNGTTSTNLDVSIDAHNYRIHFKPTKLKSYFRNNSHVPVKLYLWELKHKHDHVTNPVQSLTSAFDDMSGGDNGYETSVMWWPSNASGFLSQYKLEKAKQICLQPGEEFNHYMYSKAFVHDMEKFYNDQTILYRRNSARTLLIRVQGVVAHSKIEANDDEIGICIAKLDAVHEVHYTFNMRRSPTDRRVFQQVNSLNTMVDAVAAMPAQVVDEDDN
jgi:hypothetical protein